MDLVGAQEQVVLHAKFREPHELVAAPDAGERIVGIAEIK